MRQQVFDWLASASIDINNDFVLIVLAFFSIAIILFIGLLLRFAIKRSLAFADKTPTVWDDALLASFQGPLSLLVWTIGISYVAEIFWFENPDLIALLVNLRVLIIIFCVTWFVLRFLNQSEAKILSDRYQHISFDKAGVRAINKVLKISAVITAGLVTLNYLGYSITGLLAFGGVGGIVVGLAAKDLLANFFGGLMVYLDRPFKEGEVIRLSDKDIVGEVEDIGWRLTKIRNFQKRLLYVPNSVFNEVAIENFSRMTHRRLRDTVGVRYDDALKVPQIAAAIEAMLRDDPAADTSLPLVVRLDYFNASSVDIFINVYTHTTDWTEFHKCKQEWMMRIYQIVEEHGAEIAFPTRTLHIEQASDQS